MNEQNLNAIRNERQIITYSASGDWTSYTNKFTVKEDKDSNSMRYVDHDVTVTYDATEDVSIFTVDLLPFETSAISKNNYVWDNQATDPLDSTIQHTPVSGAIFFTLDVRTITDGTSITSTTQQVAEIQGSDFEVDTTLGSDGTDIIGRSVAEQKALLGLPKNIYVAKWYQSGTDDPLLSSLRINTFSTSPIVNIMRMSAGVYYLVTTGIESASIADIKIRDMDESYAKLVKGGYSGATPIINVFNRADGIATDGFSVMIEIKQWA